MFGNCQIFYAGGAFMARDGRGIEKGVRMKKEILRMHSKGLGKKTIARALKISVNTVKKYLKEAVAEEIPGSTPASEAGYSAPWAPKVDWKAVKSEADKGTAIS
jgi:orotate phosphoribosyltransferase-like protein